MRHLVSNKRSVDRWISRGDHKEIDQWIITLARYYRRLYGLETDEEINEGKCDEFAEDLKRLLGHGSLRYDGGDDTTCWEWGFNHCFLEVDGRFYDSESPHGVDDWRRLNYYIRYPQDI